MKKVKFSSKKLIISGNIFELYLFDEPRRVDPLPHSTNTTPSPTKPKEKKQQREKRSIYRSKKKLIRLINSNVRFHFNSETGKPHIPLFVTFTFAKNMQDMKLANYKFTKFIQRFNYEVFGTKKARLAYVVAIEFQKRGAIHYHAIFFNLPFVENLKDILSEVWTEGFTDYEIVKNNITDVGNYITKYMHKENSDPRLVGKKCYFSSKSLFKSAIIRDSQKVDAIMSFVPEEEMSYERYVEASEYGCGYNYRVYNVSDTGFIKGSLDLFVKPGYLDEKL